MADKPRTQPKAEVVTSGPVLPHTPQVANTADPLTEPGRRQQQKQLEADVRKLEERRKLLEQVPFDKIPMGLRMEGNTYITPSALFEAEVTKYRPQYILELVRRGEIPHYKLAGQIVLGPAGVTKLLQREQASLSGKLRAGGNKPGNRVR